MKPIVIVCPFPAASAWLEEADMVAIMTRSRAKKTPNQYTSIPFPLKALKIILKELHLYKTTGAGKGKGKKVGDDGVLYAEDDGVSGSFIRESDLTR
jgi:hypothetical protein